MAFPQKASPVIMGIYTDRAQPIHFWPEVELPAGYVFRLYISDMDTGEEITPSDGLDYWGVQVPADVSGYDLPIDEYYFVVDLNLLYERAGRKFGSFNGKITRYDPANDLRLYTEQGFVIVLADKGLKLPGVE